MSNDLNKSLIDEAKACPFCMNALNNGLTHYVDPQAKHKMVCTCGWISRGFDTVAGLLEWYNSRGNRKWKAPTVEATHNKTQVQADLEGEIKSVTEGKEQVF